MPVSCFSLLFVFESYAAEPPAPIHDHGPVLITNPSGVPVVSAGTKKMVERLARLRENIDVRQAPFVSERVVEAMRQALPHFTNDWQKEARLRFQLGIKLTEAGQPDEAIKEYQLAEDLVRNARSQSDERTRVELRMRRVVAFLRAGEQENCLMNHNADSCLVPLRPPAFYRSPRGPRAALGLLNEQLAEFPEDLAARWLLNLAHMTLGEYPDKISPQWLIPPKIFASEYPLPRFPDVAGPLGLDNMNLAGGAILDDFDNDGFVDIVITSMSLSGQMRFYHNDGDGHFTDRTVQAGLAGLVGGLNLMQTDYNNDGLLDILVLRGGWYGKPGRMPKSLLKNNGDGTFSDVTEEAGLLTFHPSQTATWFDYDGDGWLDLFVGNETTDDADPDMSELFHNNRDGTFTECAALCGLNVKRFVKGVTCADYDHDGRPDLYLSCRDAQNLLFHNDGPAEGANGPATKWKFTEVSRTAGVTDPVFSFSTWFFDYDNDGWEDLFVSGYKIRNVGDVAADYLGKPHDGTLPKLYHNNRDGTFTDVTASTHLNRLCHTMGCNFGDLDNDGWLDFYLGTGDPDLTTLVPNRMFRNAGGKYFQDVTTATDTGSIQKGHGVGFADLDNDGDQDVFIEMGGAYPGDLYHNSLFMNPGNTNHWLKLKLEGVKANRAAIGARVKVTVTAPAGPREIFKTVNSGASFGCSPLRQEFGLGDATSVTAVDILWPGSGRQQHVDGLALDQAYKIREGDSKATVLPLRRIQFDLTAKPAHHHHPDGM
ncbi:MAG TPA: CRTAC1 family protein [Verrucomicrobiae bacterium]|nr:CRTAC1 family protein [Verrucomicrobiae bacterium]